MPGYVRAALHTFRHEKPKRPQDSTHPWTQPIYVNINHILNKKKPSEELDVNIQK